MQKRLQSNLLKKLKCLITSRTWKSKRKVNAKEVIRNIDVEFLPLAHIHVLVHRLVIVQDRLIIEQEPAEEEILRNHPNLFVEMKKNTLNILQIQIFPQIQINKVNFLILLFLVTLCYTLIKA